MLSAALYHTGSAMRTTSGRRRRVAAPMDGLADVSSNMVKCNTRLRVRGGYELGSP